MIAVCLAAVSNIRGVLKQDRGILTAENCGFKNVRYNISESQHLKPSFFMVFYFTKLFSQTATSAYLTQSQSLKQGESKGEPIFLTPLFHDLPIQFWQMELRPDKATLFLNNTYLIKSKVLFYFVLRKDGCYDKTICKIYIKCLI